MAAPDLSPILDDLVMLRANCDRYAVRERASGLAQLTGGHAAAVRDAAAALRDATSDDGWRDWDAVDLAIGTMMLALRA